jgi:phosphatidylglycerophosphate synthase
MIESKVPMEMHNELDVAFYEISDALAVQLRKIDGMTPNIITTIGLLFGVIGLLMLYKNKKIYSIVFLWLYYFSDCLDGLYARKYRMETEFGDYYDHFRDWSIGTLYGLMICIKLKTFHRRSVFLLWLTVLSVLSMVYMGCQERLFEMYPEYRNVAAGGCSPSLSFMCDLVGKGDPRSSMKVVKYFSPCLINIFFTGAIMFTK